MQLTFLLRSNRSWLPGEDQLCHWIPAYCYKLKWHATRIVPQDVAAQHQKVTSRAPPRVGGRGGVLISEDIFVAWEMKSLILETGDLSVTIVGSNHREKRQRIGWLIDRLFPVLNTSGRSQIASLYTLSAFLSVCLSVCLAP